MRRICTEEEQALFADCQNDTERADLLSVLWPMKESYVKRDGRGLSRGLDQVSCAAYLREYKNLKQCESVDCLTVRQSEGRIAMPRILVGGGDADTAQTDITVASTPEMCIFVHNAYTFAACGCANTELVRVIEDSLYVI